MSKKQNLKTGDIVFLKSDISGEHPMTIIADCGFMDDGSTQWQVCWLNRSGTAKYSGFPEGSLRKSENIK